MALCGLPAYCQSVGRSLELLTASHEDFNTPLAMIEFNKLPKLISSAISANNTTIYPELNYIVKRLGEEVLGLNFGEKKQKAEDAIPSNIVELAENRWQAKKNRDFATADDLRKQISELGYDIIDSKEGYQITKRTEEK